MTQEIDIREIVRERYAAEARRVAAEGGAACCDPPGAKGPISRDIYSLEDVADLPEKAVLASLGCGNPTALAELRPGEVVLDLGSGGGIDVLLSARRVGPSGKAYGLDMTDEMLELARQNQREAGVANAEFLKGHMEEIPLPDGSVDVIISNCVINLSPDKDRVLREAFRVLRPGGRFAVSDIVVQGRLPEEVRGNMDLWCGCLAGALHEDEYREKLAAAGFRNVEVEVTRVLAGPGAEGWPATGTAGGDVPLTDVTGRFASAFIRARKPA